MSGDYSRIRFDAKKHYSAVLAEQGRVGLDADGNEYIDLQDRRWRAETLDVIGRSGVPSQTPGGFKIENNAGELTIGIGRMYVDGFLAENHGDELWQFDPILAEEVGTSVLTIADQPYSLQDFVQPDVGKTLLYLDVWRREVTHLQQPDLIEPAIDIDTSTRYQTAWQVRLLENVAEDVDCQTPLEDIPNWPEANLPSGARLTTTTTNVGTDDDPCIVPPTGGYRGLNNAFYRVEVHAIEGDEVAIKWSRENASVAVNLLEVLAGSTEIRVDSLGRDDYLGFTTGDWVEITSDKRELAGLSGEIRQVTVNTTEKTLSFSGALPTSDFPVGAAVEEEHWRVIRWDQKGTVLRPDGTVFTTLDSSTDGLIHLSLADNSIMLEHGVQITLDWIASGAKVRDFWCFAARTADADIERLTFVAPLGVHHHFACLGFVESDGDEFVGEVDDCRPKFPPLTEIQPGCCTVVVKVGDNIQSAINSLPVEGGCVCLKTGEHFIDEPIRIANSNIVLHGETAQTTVTRTSGTRVLHVEAEGNFEIEDITIKSIQFAIEDNDDETELVYLRRAVNLAIEHCRFTALAAGDGITGFIVNACKNLSIRHCEIANTSMGFWVIADSTELNIANNHWHTLTDNNEDAGIAAIYAMDVYNNSHRNTCRFEHNHIDGFLNGIVIGKDLPDGTGNSVAYNQASFSVVAHNQIRRRNTGNLPGNKAGKWFAIDIAASHCDIRNNRMIYSASYHGGIFIRGSNCKVNHNTLQSLAFNLGNNKPLGIQHGLYAVEDNEEVNAIARLGQLLGNKLTGEQHGIVVVNSDNVLVSQNQCIQDQSDELQAWAISASKCEDLTIENNHIEYYESNIICDECINTHIFDNTLEHGIQGISINAGRTVLASRNKVVDIAHWGFLSNQTLGKMAVKDCYFANCGFSNPLAATSVASIIHMGEWQIQQNEIRDTGLNINAEAGGANAMGIVGFIVLQAHIQSNFITYTDPMPLDLQVEYRGIYLMSFFEYSVAMAAGSFDLGFPAQILDNKIAGSGQSALIELPGFSFNDVLHLRYDRVTFNNNYAWHFNSTSKEAVTLDVVAHYSIVEGNQFKSNTPLPSVNFHGSSRSIYMGNIGSAEPINFNGIPTPVSAFNQIG